MAITGPASYDPTMLEFLAHWGLCNAALPPATPLKVRLPGTDTLVPRSYFDGLYNSMLAQQTAVQTARGAHALARATLLTQKTALLEKFGQFTARLDASYQNTPFYQMRPYAPGIGYGKSAFNDPLGEMLDLWTRINAGPAPAGVTLPLTLKDNFVVTSFASMISSLQFAYKEEFTKEKDLQYARALRNVIQDEAYQIMKWYRETVPVDMAAFPALVATMPRLTPLPGHTPDAVNASAIFEAPDKSKVVYDASPEPTLHSYQLRGNAGDEYSDEDAVVIATNEPGAPREFVTTMGLNQPGAKVALKVYVILTTGNEAGSAPMFVQRPFSAVA